MASPGPGSAVQLPLEREVLTASAAETRDLGARLAGVAQEGDVIALFGELGAGKTELVKGFARGLGVRGVVNSPSFVLMAEYRGRLPLFHLDLFRLAGARDAIDGGLLDERRTAGVTLIEWADRIRSLLPPQHLAISIAGSGDDPRRIVLASAAPRYERYLRAAREAGA